MLSRFHLILGRYGRTYRQTDRFAISISRVSVLTRDKKRIIPAIITGRISSFCLLLYYTPNSLCWLDDGPPYKNVVSKVDGGPPESWGVRTPDPLPQWLRHCLAPPQGAGIFLDPPRGGLHPPTFREHPSSLKRKNTSLGGCNKLLSYCLLQTWHPCSKMSWSVSC